MMQFTIDYNIDLTGLKLIQRRLEDMKKPESFSSQAVMKAGDHLLRIWSQVAGQRLKHSTGGYTNAIMEGVDYPYQNNPLHFVVVNRHKAVILLEEGYESWDMKKMLQTSHKIRVSKKGRKYLIIPFTHGTPESKTQQAMPADIYEEAKQLAPSVKTMEAGKSPRMKWGERLTEAGMRGMRSKIYEFGKTKNPQYEGANATGHYTWKSSIYENMYRVKTNKGSVYLTFRVMGEGSKGWIHPVQPALHIAKDAVQQAKPHVLHLLSNGVRQDLGIIGIT